MIDTTFWDHVGPDFLANDRAHPSRAIAGALVAAASSAVSASKGRGLFRMCEIGPGPGFDYADHFSKIPENLGYVAFEASHRMLDRIRVPGIEVCRGGFREAEDAGYWDVAYTRATLEHQPDFQDGLGCMICSADLVIVTWFLPPGDRDEIVFREDTGVHNNRYARARVLSEIEKAGGKLLAALPVRWEYGNDNAIYVIRGTR